MEVELDTSLNGTLRKYSAYFFLIPNEAKGLKYLNDEFPKEILFTKVDRV